VSLEEMTLDSYLRDLLGASALQINIVDDNATTTNNSDNSTNNISTAKARKSMARSSSWFASNARDKQTSRWENNMSRRKSDSALGKPQRRDSADKEELWSSANAVMTNAVMIAEDFNGDCESDSAVLGMNDSLLRMPTRYTDSGSSFSSRDAGPLPTPLVRAFSDVAGKKTASSEIRSINKAMKALDKIRSRPQLVPMSPPTMPTRRSSCENLPERDNSMELSNNPPISSKLVDMAPKEAGLLRPVSSIDFPKSLRDLPYAA
jgi:hypothetical protein